MTGDTVVEAVATVRLTAHQRAALVDYGALPFALREVLAAAGPVGTRPIPLTPADRAILLSAAEFLRDTSRGLLRDRAAAAARRIRDRATEDSAGVDPFDLHLTEGSITAGPDPDVYQFRVEVLGVAPPVWRRIQVVGGRLAHLADYLHVAVGWYNTTEYRFAVGGATYDPMAAKSVSLRDLLPPRTAAAGWAFWPDAAGAWEHAVTFEGRARRLQSLNYDDAAEPVAVEYPLCVGGAGACPPSSTRDPAEYALYATAVADPAHPRHAHYKAYHRPYGDGFDPARTTAWMRRATEYLDRCY